MVRGFLRVSAGFLAAVLVSGLVQVMFARPPVDLAGLPQSELLQRLEARAILALATATHSAIFAGLFALLAITVAEWLRVRGALYYALTGLAIALAGFLAEFASENASQPTIVNTYALIAYATTGLASGFTYWLIAGRRAGRRRRTLETDRAHPRPRTDEAASASRSAEPRTSQGSSGTTSVPSTRGPNQATRIEAV